MVIEPNLNWPKETQEFSGLCHWKIPDWCWHQTTGTGMTLSISLLDSSISWLHFSLETPSSSLGWVSLWLLALFSPIADRSTASWTHLVSEWYFKLRPLSFSMLFCDYHFQTSAQHFFLLLIITLLPFCRNERSPFHVVPRGLPILVPYPGHHTWFLATEIVQRMGMWPMCGQSERASLGWYKLVLEKLPAASEFSS